jgi:hypothetical protein
MLFVALFPVPGVCLFAFDLYRFRSSAQAVFAINCIDLRNGTSERKWQWLSRK